MKLTLKRVALRDTYTIGKLSINDEYFCDTLEDKVRDLNKDGDLDEPGEAKVWGETAIPYGTYKVVKFFSSKFKREMPLLVGVKTHQGILIHAGTDEKNTLGCILVGENKVVGKVLNSRATFDKLWPRLDAAFKTMEPVIIIVQ